MKMEPPTCCSEIDASTKGFTSMELKQDDLTEQIDGTKLESTNDPEQRQKLGNSPKNLDVDKVSGTANEKAVTSSENGTDSMDCSADVGLQGLADAKKENGRQKNYSIDDMLAIDSAGKSGMGDSRAANDYRSTVVPKNKEGGNRNSDDSAVFLSRIEGMPETDRVDKHNNDKNEEHPADFSGSELHTKDLGVVQKNSGTDLDYNIVDPLEVARLVAIEAKREVDCREQSCSSSDKLPGGEVQRPDSPDSACGAQSRAQEDSSKEESVEPDLSADSSLPGEEEPALSSGSPDAEPINGTQEMECSQVTDVAQELPANADKGVCNFDLNLEVCSEDVDNLENPISIPISVVSASRPAAAPGLPVAPLQFEGALGWKGSAATSAFRPASPRRIPEAGKAHSTGGSNSSSKQRDGCLDIDLNINESFDEKTTDPLLEKHIQALSGLPSGESSVDASPRRLERVELDLNRASDDGDAPSDWRTEGLVFRQRNGYLSHSPSSSSSSKQPSLRNIDLNDHPSFVIESSDHSFLSKLSQTAPGIKRSDDSVISIMGMKVEVNRKDFSPQSLPLLNGRNLDPTLDVNFARTGGPLGMGSAVPYTHTAVYGYNGLASGPGLPFASSTYGPGGPIPYLLDSRGAPVVPQVMGSASTVPPAFAHPPFFMSMNSTPPSNGAGPSRNSFDLNSGLTMEAGNRETGGLRPFLSPAVWDDYMKSNSQASTSSGTSAKRKEPDSSWEPFRPHPPTWK